jgi:GNAT superfamily N-acetyltransferase
MDPQCGRETDVLSTVVVEEEVVDGNLAAELTPIFQAHWEEVDKYRDKVPLDVDWAKYMALYEAGQLKAYVARVDGKLVGYMVVVVTTHPHFNTTLHGVTDAIYVQKEYRKSNLAAGLIKYAEKELKEAGVMVLTMSMKAWQPFESLMERLEWEKSEIIYSKVIGE